MLLKKLASHQHNRPTLYCQHCGPDARYGYYLLEKTHELDADYICCMSCGDTREIRDKNSYFFPEPSQIPRYGFKTT